MIKTKTMYDLYHTALIYQIEEQQVFIKKQLEKVNNYISKMEEVSKILSEYIDYNKALNGEIPSLPFEVLALNNVNINYANLVLRNYYELRQPIQIASKEIERLKNQQISYSIYKEIISLHNKKVVQYLVQTGKSFENQYLGKLKLVYRTNTKAVVNWNESNKNKKRLIEQGLLPYKKEDEQKAIENGEEYKGVKWLVTGYNKGLLLVKWSVPTIVKELLNKDIHNFKYIPARGHYGIMSILTSLYTTDYDTTKYDQI